MSTVMYCFWVDKDKMFDLADHVREYCYENMFIFKYGIGNWDYLLKAAKEKENQTSMQLFDVDPDRYLVRFLSGGYLIENNYYKFNMEPCVYDDRSDVEEEDEQNLKYAEQIDKLIMDRQYFIIPIVDREGIIEHAVKLFKPHDPNTETITTAV